MTSDWQTKVLANLRFAYNSIEILFSLLGKLLTRLIENSILRLFGLSLCKIEVGGLVNSIVILSGQKLTTDGFLYFSLKNYGFMYSLPNLLNLFYKKPKYWAYCKKQHQEQLRQAIECSTKTYTIRDAQDAINFVTGSANLNMLCVVNGVEKEFDSQGIPMRWEMYPTNKEPVYIKLFSKEDVLVAKLTQSLDEVIWTIPNADDARQILRIYKTSATI